MVRISFFLQASGLRDLTEYINPKCSSRSIVGTQLMSKLTQRHIRIKIKTVILWYAFKKNIFAGILK